jgi:ERCC4-type nuclease
MKLISDTREQAPLKFSICNGVEYVVGTLNIGDYSASYTIGGETIVSSSIVERKSIGDLFGSYTSGYENERKKFLRAIEAKKKFILAIEGTVSEILKGHSYTKGGEEYVARKDGMTMLRQLMSCCHRYNISLWCCSSRSEMAMMIQEYFLAEERQLKKHAEEKRN